MAEYTPGGSGTGGRDARYRAVLARWTVLAEPWAQELERRRTRAAEDVYVPPAAKAGANAAEAGITPLQAINRALGLPDDHGVDAVVERRDGAPG